MRFGLMQAPTDLPDAYRVPRMQARGRDCPMEPLVCLMQNDCFHFRQSTRDPRGWCATIHPNHLSGFWIWIWNHGSF
jgi:hypothetical protein